MFMLISVTTLILLVSYPTGFGVSALDEKTESLDLDNPIDLEKQLQQQKLSSQSNKGQLPQLPIGSRAPITPLPTSDNIDDSRHRGISSKIAPKDDDRIAFRDETNTAAEDDGRSPSRRWSGENFSDHRRPGFIEEITSEERRKDVSEIIERQREYDRRMSGDYGGFTRDPQRPTSDQYFGHRPPVRPWGGNRIKSERPDFRPNEEEIVTRIQAERDEEIRREIEKAVSNRKKIWDEMERNKNRRVPPFYPQSKYEEMELNRNAEKGKETRRGEEKQHLQPENYDRRTESYLPGSDKTKPYPPDLSQSTLHPSDSVKREPFQPNADRKDPYPPIHDRRELHPPYSDKREQYSPDLDRRKPYLPNLDKREPFYPNSDRKEQYRPDLDRRKPYPDSSEKRDPYPLDSTRREPYQTPDLFKSPNHETQWDTQTTFKGSSEKTREDHRKRFTGSHSQWGDQTTFDDDSERRREEDRWEITKFIRPERKPQPQWEDQDSLKHDIENIRENDRRESLKFSNPSEKWGEQTLIYDNVEQRREKDRQRTFGEINSPTREQMTFAEDIEKKREKDREQSSSTLVGHWEFPGQLKEDIEKRREKDRLHASGPNRFRRDFMSDRNFWLSSKPYHKEIELDIQRPIDIHAHNRRGRERKRDLEKLKEENEERLREIERRRTQDILNQQKGNRFEEFREGRKRHFGGEKPPILIYEEIAVPVPIKEYDHSGEINRDRYHKRPYKGPRGSANPPPLIISDLYDHRAPDRKHPFLDRRPGRPDLDSEEKVVHVEEGILVHNALVPGNVPVHLGVPVPPIVPIVDPSVEAHLALTSEAAAASELEKLNHAAAAAAASEIERLKHAAAASEIERLKHAAAAASEIERLNHAAAIADIKRIQKLQVTDAVIKNQIKKQAIAHAVSNQAALAEAAKLNRLTNIQQAVALSNIKKQVDDATRVQAVSDQVALTEAAEQEAILSHSLINDQLVATALTEDHITNSQKIDFINLVLKHGLRKVLQQQLRQHLKNRAQQETFIHKLQTRKEDLVKRLLLLKPYFTSPGRGGFILPAFIPNIPVGAHLNTAQIAQLPKIHLLPSTHLLSPGFNIPHEIAASIQKEIDIGFVEHILRLPEKIFQRILHLPKQDFILTLFPRLYRETIKHLQINPEEHYFPNAPHAEVVKEHHHHHIHIHQPPKKKDPTKYPVSSAEIPHQGYPPLQHSSHYGFSEERDKYHFQQQADSYFGVRPTQKEIILPTSDHTLQNVAHGVQLPLEESSYVSYDPSPFDNHHHHPSSHEHRPHSSGEIKFSSIPIQLSQDSIHPSGSGLRGINVRIKGETGHENVRDTFSSKPHPDLFQHVFPFSEELHGRFTSSKQHSGSEEIIPFGFRRNDNFPLAEFSDESVTTSTPFSSSHISLTTLQPFSKGIVTTTRPSTLKPSPVRPIVTPRPSFHSSISTTHSPTSTIFPTTPRPTFITTISSFPPSLTTFETKSEEEFDGNRVVPFTTNIPFKSKDVPTVSPANPFQGFNENVDLEITVERQNGVDEAGNDLERPPGTDTSDDDHLFSVFQKKKGNATKPDKNGLHRLVDETEKNRERGSNDPESVVNQIRHITNSFGARTEESRRARQGRTNFTAPSPTNFFSSTPNNPDEPAILESFLSHPPPSQSSAVIQDSSHNNEFSKVHPIHEVKQLPNAANKRIPMPKRIDPSSIPFGGHITQPSQQGTSFHSKGFGLHNAGFPFQGEPDAFGARSVAGRGHSTFPGLPFQNFGNIPSFLKKSPKCSEDGLIKKSFCLYPKGYENEIGDSIIAKNKKEIERMIQILSKIPSPKVDLNAAAKQIPTLDLSVTCETEDREVQLSWSRDIIGSWFTILQTKPFEQKVTVTTCGNKARAQGCRPLLQPRPFIAFHPEDVTRKAYVMEFPLPVGCVLASTSGEDTQKPF